MKIVGVGCGPGMLTEEAIRAISSAKSVHGSQRALDLAARHVPEGCEAIVIKDYSNLGSLPDDAVVLSTGDPMLAGLGRKGGVVVPGISSLQVAAARLGLDLSSVAVVDGHGRGGYEEEVASFLEMGRRVFLIADPKTDVRSLAGSLSSRGLRGRIAVCQDLGYDDEAVLHGTFDEPPRPTSGMFSLVIGSW